MKGPINRWGLGNILASPVSSLIARSASETCFTNRQKISNLGDKGFGARAKYQQFPFNQKEVENG